MVTKISLSLALQVARQRLEYDDSLSDRTNLNVEEIMLLLSLFLNATYFSFCGIIYQQIQGTAMGSPVSVVMANMVMENVDKRALETFTTPFKCWKRYVDDVFCIVPKDLVASLFEHINNIKPSSTE